MTTVPASGESLSQAPTYEWLADANYLPTLSEVQEAQSTEEGREAIDDYYQPFPGLERFEIWTQEYIAELSNHIVRTMVQAGGYGGTVLEVGAGDGRLAGLLGQRLKAEGLDGAIATDMNPPEGIHFPVEQLDYKEALEKYNPKVVLSSWMPLYEEWTIAMRATAEVEEYIVIGVPPMTGNRSTWRGYASPETGEFEPVQLHHLDALKEGQFSDHEIPYLSLTRGFHRVSEAPSQI